MIWNSLFIVLFIFLPNLLLVTAKQLHITILRSFSSQSII
uniref:Uncharacterized protein n=1 Tax=Tetranychus urticae TaxID=32264 RepID=T1KVX0_TETUR